ncbi:MAG: BolA/IbaG family iron-sulfur metabolism protein [Pseudomonadota bacterium]
MSIVEVSEKNIAQAIQQQQPNAKVAVVLSGNHAKLVIVDDHFQGLSSLKRQQAVYAALTNWIQSGQLHAVNMETFTATEWRTQSLLREDVHFHPLSIA